MSVGFISGRGNSRIEQRADKPHREILNFKQLLDVSPTWDPAYQSTEAAFRSLRAVQMAESLEAAQQVLQGAHQQLEDGVQLSDTDASIDLASTDDDDLRVPDGDTVGPSPELAHSGVGEARNLLAARKRRLALLGVTLLTTDKV